MKPLLHELRNRKIVQWALAYCAGAWVFLEAASLLGEQFGFPSVAFRIFWAVAGTGLLLTLVLAWYHGERGAQRVSGPELVIIATLLAVAGGILWVLHRPTASSLSPTTGGVASEPDQPIGSIGYLASVAVLPLQNLGPAEDQYLGQGFADELITQLAQVPGLKVSSWTSVSALQGSNLTLPQIADTLGVDHVLEGSIRRSGSATRITVQLIEARSDAHLWASSFDRELGNLFQVQEEIAREALRALLEVVPGLRSPAPQARTDQGEAYQAYLQGRYAVHHRNRESLSRAIDAFRAAITVDGDFAPAYSGLSAAYGLWLRYGYPTENQEYGMAGRALAAADHALGLDPESGEAFAARGWLKTLAWAPLEEIEADFLRAIELLPNATDAHGWYGHYLVRAGRLEEALREARKAIELDPLAPGRRVGYAMDAIGMRRFDLALQESERALTLEPSLNTAKFSRVLALLLSERYQECLSVDPGPHLAIRAMCLHAVGRAGAEEALVAEVLSTVEDGNGNELGTSTATLMRDLSLYFAWVGDFDESMGFMGRVFDSTPYGMDFRLWMSGIFDPMKAQASFLSGFSDLCQASWNRSRAEWQAAEGRVPESLFQTGAGSPEDS